MWNMYTRRRGARARAANHAEKFRVFVLCVFFFFFKGRVDNRSHEIFRRARARACSSIMIINARGVVTCVYTRESCCLNCARGCDEEMGLFEAFR